MRIRISILIYILNLKGRGPQSQATPSPVCHNIFDVRQSTHVSEVYLYNRNSVLLLIEIVLTLEPVSNSNTTTSSARIRICLCDISMI